MEKKRNTKHHDDKHGQQPHRPRDAFELYELEHMPHTFVKVPSDRPKPRAPEAFKPDYHEKGRTVQHQEDGDVGVYKENIDAMAEAFIMWEHEKFDRNKWMSMNGY
ncbi:hypothetical protein Pfo_024261 [Paulownia fortunei]|nr:hypothetical protein Pfo_024261 [Paulownia fortunei]